MLGIVIVAHSRELPVAVAGGIDDAQNLYGTDAIAICDAVHSVNCEDGVVVLMNMGSSLLSAEVALDFLPEELRERVRLCGAPLVEGVIAAAVCAAGAVHRR